MRVSLSVIATAFIAAGAVPGVQAALPKANEYKSTDW
jgi:hypothetical protein